MYVDQIFAIEIMIEEYLGKDEHLYAVFMDLDVPSSSYVHPQRH